MTANTLSKDEVRAIRHLFVLANNDLMFDLELVTMFATLRETYGLAALLRMIQQYHDTRRDSTTAGR